MPTTNHVTVSADDGTPLVVREFGPPDAPLTVVFVHGHCQSGAADPSTYTIDQLGHDPEAVLRTVAQTGPVVLVGHSMGAMGVLAYARLYPAAIGTRIIGIGLLAAAAGGITSVGPARFLNRRAVNSFQVAALRAPRVMQASKRFSRRRGRRAGRAGQRGHHRTGPALCPGGMNARMIDRTRRPARRTRRLRPARRGREKRESKRSRTVL